MFVIIFIKKYNFWGIAHLLEKLSLSPCTKFDVNLTVIPKNAQWCDKIEKSLHSIIEI